MRPLNIGSTAAEALNWHITGLDVKWFSFIPDLDQ